MRVKVLKSGIFVEIGQVLEVPRIEADRLVRQKRAELVPGAPATPGRGAKEEKMVPQRQPERMKRK